MGFLTLRSFLFSLALHAVVISALIINFDTVRTPVFKPRPVQNIVEAVTVDDQAVEQELQRLRELELEKQRAMEEKLKQLEQQAGAVEKRRRQEEQRQREAEQQRKEEERRSAAERQRIQEEQRRAEAKRQHTEERQHKAEAELERIEEDKRKAEAERQRIEEDKRKAEAERQRIEEDKRKAEAEHQRIEEERRRAEAERQRRAEEKKKKEAEAAQRKQRAQEQQAQDNIALQNIVADIYRAVAGNFNKTGLPKGLECVLSVQTVPGGEVISVTINKPSGNEVFDRRAVTAVEKASPLPLPSDQAVFERLRLRKFNFIFKPEN